MLGHGKPRRLLRLHTAVASKEMLAELADVLEREKFALTPAQITRLLTIYARRSEVVDLDRRVNAVDADPDDDIVLGTAVNGGATLIVTGDRHLLEMREFEGVRIIPVDSALKTSSAERA